MTALLGAMVETKNTVVSEWDAKEFELHVLPACVVLLSLLWIK